MPCRHGEVFWWDCRSCQLDEEQRRRNAETQERQAQAKRELETLSELQKVRRLLEEKNNDHIDKT